MSRKNLLLAHIIIPLAFGALAARIVVPAFPNWYSYLEKPFFNPPAWLFAAVWTVLYLMIGFAAYLIDISKSKSKEKVLKYYWGQLMANFLWPVIFFGMQKPRLAFIEILILWFLIYQTLTKFFRISKTAGFLLLPYIVWVTFAATLNLSIIILN